MLSLLRKALLLSFLLSSTLTSARPLPATNERVSRSGLDSTAQGLPMAPPRIRKTNAAYSPWVQPIAPASLPPRLRQPTAESSQQLPDRQVAAPPQPNPPPPNQLGTQRVSMGPGGVASSGPNPVAAWPPGSATASGSGQYNQAYELVGNPRSGSTFPPSVSHQAPPPAKKSSKGKEKDSSASASVEGGMPAELRDAIDRLGQPRGYATPKENAGSSYFCHSCGALSASKQNLGNHIRGKNHMNKEPHFCICGKFTAVNKRAIEKHAEGKKEGSHGYGGIRVLDSDQQSIYNTMLEYGSQPPFIDTPVHRDQSHFKVSRF